MSYKTTDYLFGEVDVSVCPIAMHHRGLDASCGMTSIHPWRHAVAQYVPLPPASGSVSCPLILHQEAALPASWAEPAAAAAASHMMT